MRHRNQRRHREMTIDKKVDMGKFADELIFRKFFPKIIAG